MPGAKFDILFAGELVGDADPSEVRRQLQQRFKLSDEVAARLFSGRALALKKGVDAATASRYREVFRNAGALVEIRRVADHPDPLKAPLPESAKGPAASDPEGEQAGAGAGGLRLAPDADQSKPLEQAGVLDRPAIDIGHLRLVPGRDWTLEDCQPLPSSIDPPDTSYLKLVTPPPDSREEPGD
jgi:hypothetical protein